MAHREAETLSRTQQTATKTDTHICDHTSCMANKHPAGHTVTDMQACTLSFAH